MIETYGAHPLIGAVHVAFAEHRPLRLSPDAVWLTIAQGIAQHVRINAGSLRGRLVRDHERRSIEVEHHGPVPRDDRGAWDAIVSKEQLDEDRRERQPMYPHEFVSVMNCAGIPIAARRIYVLATYLYLRPQELYALRWSDVDWAAREVRIRRKLNPRTGKERPGAKSDAGVREVPIHPHLMPLLKAMYEEAGRDDAARLVVPATGVRKLTDQFAADTREALKLAKVARTELVDGTPDLMPFDFRSWRTTGCTWLAMIGTDSYVIALQAGHKSPDTTWGSYIKRGPDLRQRYGEPFPVLPAQLITEVDWAKHWAKLEKDPKNTVFSERDTGFEPATSSLGSWHSTN